LAGRRSDAELQVLEATCANPRCDEQFQRELGPGRRKDFHSDECRRRAEQDRRRLASRLEHYERQAEQMRARIAAYVRTGIDEMTEGVAAGPTAEQIRRAREAIAEVRGMTRFLRGHQDEFAKDLLKLFDEVEPAIARLDG
jgi:hypothetical protein